MKQVIIDGKFNFPNGSNPEPLFSLSTEGSKNGLVMGNQKARLLYRVLTDPALSKDVAAALAEYLGKGEAHAVDEERKANTPTQTLTHDNIKYGLFADGGVRRWVEPIRGNAHWRPVSQTQAEFITAASFANRDSLAVAIKKAAEKGKSKRKTAAEKTAEALAAMQAKIDAITAS